MNVTAFAQRDTVNFLRNPRKRQEVLMREVQKWVKQYHLANQYMARQTDDTVRKYGTPWDSL